MKSELENCVSEHWRNAEIGLTSDLIQVFKVYRGLAEPKFEDFFELDIHSRIRGHPVRGGATGGHGGQPRSRSLPLAKDINSMF